MLKQTLAVSLLSLTAWGTHVLPGRADVATVQTSTQQTYVEGVGNGSSQVIRQESVYRVNRRGPSSTGIVQDTFQDTVIFGGGNVSTQSSDQVNVIESVNSSRRGRSRVYIEQR